MAHFLKNDQARSTYKTIAPSHVSFSLDGLLNLLNEQSVSPTTTTTTTMTTMMWQRMIVAILFSLSSCISRILFWVLF